jgi:hypothetical protein
MLAEIRAPPFGRSSEVSTIQVTCPECHERLVVAPPAPGKKIRCPRCEAIFAPPQRASASAETGRRRGGPQKPGVSTGSAVATIAAAVMLVVGAAAVIVVNSNTPEAGSGPEVGQIVPEIAGEDIDGIPFKLSDYRGKVVVLDFWGHW